MAPKPKKNEGYQYTKLKDIFVGSGFNLYGIVTEIVKCGSFTSTGKKHYIFLLQDESITKENAFRIHLFLSPADELPNVEVGVIMRLHRVKIESYEDKMDGRVFRASDVLLFPSSGIGADDYHTKAKNPTLTDKDEKRLKEIREFIKTNKLFKNDDCDVTFEFSESGRIGIGHRNINENQKRAEALPKSSTVVPNPLNSHFSERGSETQELIDSFISRVSGTEKNNDDYETDSDPTDFDVACTSPFPSPKRACSKDEEWPSKKVCQSSGSTMLKPSTDTVAHIISRKTNEAEQVAPQCVDQVTTNEESEGEEDFTFAMPQLSFTLSRDEGALAKSDAEASQVPICPGVSCAGEDCPRPGPIVLDDDDPRLANFDPESLVFEGLGDIPAVDENGEIISRPNLVMSSDASRVVYINNPDLSCFQWPQFCAKVKVVAMKPCLKVLRTVGRRDLLSGHCSRCKEYTFYSRLSWLRSKVTKKAVCTTCLKNGRTQILSIDFRLKLIVEDSWGTKLQLYALSSNASELFGCSPQEYQKDKECQDRVISLLTEAYTAHHPFLITFMCVNTYLRRKYYICETVLSRALETMDVGK